MYYQTTYKSPVGTLFLVSDEDNLIGLWLEGQKYFQATLKEEPIVNDQIEILQKTKSWLDRYFKGEKPDIKELSLKPQGSLFRQEVWKILCEIPYGEVTTYGKIAKVVAQKLHKEKMSGQAVGNAVGHNPISIIIPCHRVVGTSGSLTGYAGGIDKKIELLKLEGIDTSLYSRPKTKKEIVMKKYKAIIYDIDGTLLDTLKMNMYPLMKIIKEETGEDWTFEQVLKFASYPGMKVMEELKVKDQEKTYARWVQYVNDYEDKANLYEGFEEVLEKFKEKGIQQALVSSKLREQYAIDVVSKGIDQYMAAVILEDDTSFHKPHPEPLLKCLEKLNLKAEEVLYIGDAYSDYEAAKNAHIDFGLAKWGSVASQKIPATLSFDKPIDLLKLIQ